MITYEPPEQQEVNVGDHVEGIGTVMDPDDFEVPSPVSCWCGDPATVRVHDSRWWVSCSCKSRGHDADKCPEVGGSEGFETKEEAVMAWNALMAVSRLRIDNQRLLIAFNAEHIVRQNLDIQVSRLQELVRDYDHCIMHADCFMCEYDGKLSTHCPLSPCFPDTDELRELGVEEAYDTRMVRGRKMNVRNDLAIAYHIGYDDALARRIPDSSKAGVLGPGTTTVDETECIDTRCYGDPHGGEVYHIHVMECSECGRTYEHVNGGYEYCPRCGRRVEA